MQKTDNKIKQFFINNKIPFLAYGIAFLAMILVYALYGVYPFGDKHILQLDATHAYAPRINELYTKFRTGSSLLYSWKGGLGNDFYMSFVTSLLNPFVYIGFFLKTQNITEVFALIYLFQIPSCALTFAFFLKEKYSSNDITIIIFSIMYAFCSYVTSYFTVYYWLFGVMILPIVAIGLERLIKEKKIVLYTLSLSAGIISNYVIGIFLCFFSVIYYFSQILTNTEKKSKQLLASTFSRYFKGSILSGALGAVVLIPAFISLAYTSYSDDVSQLIINFDSYFSIFKFFTAHYFDMRTTYLENAYIGLPNIYSSLLTLILLPIYFFNKQISLREKVVNICILGLIYVFFNIVVLDYIIHVFHFPVGYPHRFAFLYVFFTLNIAFTGFKKLTDLSLARLIKIFIGIFLFSTLLFFLFPIIRVSKPGVFTDKIIKENYILLFVFFIILFGLWKNRSSSKVKLKRIILSILSVIIFIELIINTTNNLLPYSEVPKRDLYVLEAYDDITNVKSHADRETAFYRTEHYPDRVYSDGKLFGFNGISMFSISYFGSGEFLKKMGVHTSHNKVEYRLSTPLLNSILGVKYSINRAFLKEKEITFFNQIDMSNDIAIYENPYALPVAFLIENKATKWNTKMKVNALEFENDFIKNTSSVSNNLFTEPMEETSISGYKITLDNSEKGYTYTVDEDILPNETPWVTYKYIIEEDGYYYLNLNGLGIDKFKVEVGGETGYSILRGFVDEKGTDTFDVGYVKTGTEITIKLEIKNRLEKHDNEEFIISELSFLDKVRLFLTGEEIPEEFEPQTGYTNLYLSKMDESVFMDVYEEYSKNSLNVTYYDDTTIRGSIKVEKDGILFTSIPYDKRWSVYINGEKAMPINLFNAYIGIPIKTGNYDIEFRYTFNAAKIALAISLIALFILLIGEYYEKLIRFFERWKKHEKHA